MKYNSDGSIQHYKARLVFCGDLQVEGFNYNEAFDPVAKMTSVRWFLAVAVAKGWACIKWMQTTPFTQRLGGRSIYETAPWIQIC